MWSLLFQQHNDPVAFLSGEKDNPRLWRRAWRQRLIMLLLILLGLGAIVGFNGDAWLLMGGYAILLPTFFMMFISFAVTTLGHAQFWLLYTLSPLLLLAALFSGLGPLTPVGWVLSWGLLFPFMLGGLVASAGAVWVHNHVSETSRDYTRRRVGGVPAMLPALSRQNQVRLARQIVAALCVVLALLVPFLFPQDTLFLRLLIGIGLLACAAGCLRLDATLRCQLFPLPLVVPSDGGAWRATFTGRWTLFAPERLVRPVLTPQLPPGELGAGVIALLAQGNLGPVVRRVSRRLAPDQAHQMVLGLSLQPGGGAAIRYLLPALPAAVQPVARLYAALAEEAARSVEFQRWLSVLTSSPGLDALVATTLAPEMTRTLTRARDALLCYSYDPILESAITALQQLIQTCYLADDQSTAPPLSWPLTLLRQVIAHGQMLSTHHNSTTSMRLLS
jgi:hypothetical protein